MKSLLVSDLQKTSRTTMSHLLLRKAWNNPHQNFCSINFTRGMVKIKELQDHQINRFYIKKFGQLLK